MNQEERRKYLIARLSDEQIPEDPVEQKNLLRRLVNVRPPSEYDDDLLKIQDEYLACEIETSGIIEASSLQELQSKIILWQGDITTLKCDAIVNAANSMMTGCYIPNHKCIDNCIHTFAGVQLRTECGKLMKELGRPAKTSEAFITKGYNLPARYVIHTIGPIVFNEVTEKETTQLAKCYQNCMSLAAENGCKSLAFCCISTGEFRFPNELAARIATATVKENLSFHPEIEQVIFNVFLDKDREIYREILESS